MKTKLFSVLIIFGILIRLLLSVTTYHRDLAAYTTSAKMIIFEGHLADFYAAVHRPDPQGRDYLLSFNYQPLAYFIPTLIYLPFSGLVAQFADGLRHTDPYALVGQTFFLPLFIFKLPFLIADLLILFLLPKLFKPGQQRLVQVLWALNPAAIFVSSLITQVDMILLLFIVLALIFRQQKHYFYAALFLGLSALTKPTALLLLPFLAVDYFQQQRSLWRSLTVFLTGVAVFIVGILPYLKSPDYRATALFADLLSKSTFAGIAISPGYAIPWFFIGLMLTFYLLVTRRLPAFAAFGAVIFSSLAFTHFHPQWFLWITPWLIWMVVEYRENLIALLTLMAWVVIWFSFGPSLHLETFFGLHLTVTLPAIIITQLNQLVLLARAWLVAFFVLLVNYRYESKT